MSTPVLTFDDWKTRVRDVLKDVPPCDDDVKVGKQIAALQERRKKLTRELEDLDKQLSSLKSRDHVSINDYDTVLDLHQELEHSADKADVRKRSAVLDEYLPDQIKSRVVVTLMGSYDAVSQFRCFHEYQLGGKHYCYHVEVTGGRYGEPFEVAVELERLTPFDIGVCDPIKVPVLQKAWKDMLRECSDEQLFQLHPTFLLYRAWHKHHAETSV